MAQENIKKEDTNKNEVEELKLKCEEYLNGWKRERADFLNYKKDEAERISSLVKYANEDIIYKLIPILDNFNLAAKHLQDQGFLQIKKQLEDLLVKEGIETIEVLGKPFDPNTMEILGETDRGPASIQTIQADTVAEEVQKGYTLNGKLIRPAKVKITK
jgi:molecular chaperone GrpE